MNKEKSLNVQVNSSSIEKYRKKLIRDICQAYAEKTGLSIWDDCELDGFMDIVFSKKTQVEIKKLWMKKTIINEKRAFHVRCNYLGGYNTRITVYSEEAEFDKQAKEIGLQLAKHYCTTVIIKEYHGDDEELKGIKC